VENTEQLCTSPLQLMSRNCS